MACFVYLNRYQLETPFHESFILQKNINLEIQILSG